MIAIGSYKSSLVRLSATVVLAAIALVVPAYGAFGQTKPPSTPAQAATAPAAGPAQRASAPPKPAASASPSFDCAKATLLVEKTVCSEPSLITLDRQLADVYARALKRWDSDVLRTQARDAQQQWIASRNGCATSSDLKGCLDDSYRHRVIELQITSGQLVVPKPVEYVCAGHENERFSAAFYNTTDPKSAVLAFGNRQVIALATRTASGSRYVAPSVDFWEHQGKAAVTWSGASFTCKPR